MIKSKRATFGLALLCGSAFGLIATPAMAEIEEIVVKAQKKEELIQKVPMAISAFTGDALIESGSYNIMDLQTQVPNLHIKTQWGRSNPQIFLRGVGINDFGELANPAVGVYYDEVFIGAPAAQLAQLYDIERIEVLRGPQGTLFGRNTTGGAISIFSKRPGDVFEGYGRVSAGNYGALFLEGGVTLPLVQDKLSSRFSFSSSQRGGWRRNLAFEKDAIETPPNLREKTNTVDNWAARAQFLWTPSPNAEFLLNINGSRDRSSNNNGKQFGLIVDPATGQRSDALGYVEPPGWRVGNTDKNTKQWYDIFGVSLRGIWGLSDHYEVTSISSYLETDRLVDLDCDQSPNKICDVQRMANTHQITQELRIASQYDGRFNWIAGGFLFHEKVTGGANFDIGRVLRTPGVPFDPVTNPFPFFLLERWGQKTLTYAGFAQLYFDLTDRITASLGGRYTYEKKNFRVHSDFLEPDLGGLIPNLAPLTDKKSWDAVSWRFSLDYQATNDILLYSSINKGFKSGGFPSQSLTPLPQSWSPFNPETVLAYEVGAKSKLFANTVRLNAALFYNDYKDLQVFSLRPVQGSIIPIALTDNAANANVLGAEVELFAQLGAFSLSVNLAWLDTEYKDYVLLPGTPNEQDFSGNSLINAPKYTAGVVAEYVIPAGANELRLRAEYEYSSKRFFSQDNVGQLSQRGYGVVHLRAAYSVLEGRADLALWARNVFNKAYLMEADSIETFGYLQYWYGTPRTFGAELTYKF
jgi:iron complex outermembrane receptor protein